MTNNNMIEIKLKRKTVKINKDDVKGLVGRNDVDLMEILKVFDNETYIEKMKNPNKKISNNMKVSLLTTLEQFVEKYTTYKNPENKRQVLYSIEKLHNEDATPKEREEDKGGLPVGDFTTHLEALVLLSLNNNLLPKGDLTAGQWALHFGLVNQSQFDGYKQMKYNSNKKKMIEHCRDITSDVVEFLNEHGTMEIRKYSDEEISVKLHEVFYSYETVIKRMQGALGRLDKDKLIEYHNDYAYGILINGNKKELTEEEQHYQKELKGILSVLSKEQLEEYEKQKKKKEYENKRVLLDPTQVSELVALKLQVKKEIEEMKENGEKVNKFLSIKLLSEKLKADGLTNSKGENQKFQFTFKTASINKYFTDKELNRYLNKNEKLKEIYDKGVEEVVNKYNDLRLEYLIEWFEKTYLKNLNYYETVEINKNYIGNKGEDLIQGERDRKIHMQKEYYDYGKRLSTALMTQEFAVGHN
ncbi:hypothetical protein ACMGE9_12330 [Macrococcus sp. EM39E]|uniref:hypothetical protein n=1 Tax=Macrococcus animalis TaxID=3395467 RepID=UPI0039BEB668